MPIFCYDCLQYTILMQTRIKKVLMQTRNNRIIIKYFKLFVTFNTIEH